MRSRASFFSAAVYRKNLSRLTPLWAVYLLVLLMILPLSLLSQADGRTFGAGDLQYLVLHTALRAGTYINLVYAAALAMVLHAWYYSSRSVNTIAALPIRREAWCLTNLLTALTCSLIPNALVALGIWAAAGTVGHAGGQPALWAFAMLTAEFVFFYGLASLCAAIVGQLAALPVLYVLLNYTAVILNYVTISVLSTFVYGMRDDGYQALSRLSPAFYLTNELQIVTKSVDDGYYCVFHGGTYLAAIGLVGLALFAVSFLLFRRRRMEAAGDVIAVPILQPVFRYCFTVFCALVLGVLAAVTFFSGQNGPPLPLMVFCLLLGGFLGYFTAVVLLKKSFRVFGREWVGFGVVAACLLAAVALMEFDVFGFERRIPDASEVESITLDGSAMWDSVVVTDEAHIADLITLHQSLLSQKHEQEALAAAYPSAESGTMDYVTVELIYQLRSGRILARSYRIYCTEALWLDDTSLARQYDEIVRDPYIVYLENTPSFDVTAAQVSYSYVGFYEADTGGYRTEELTGEEAFELYESCILPDLRDGLVGRSAVFQFDDHSQTEYQADIYLEFTYTVDGLRQTAGGSHGTIPLAVKSINIQPTEGSRTARWLEDQGFSLTLRADVPETF